jgi:carbonic anhydrase
MATPVQKDLENASIAHKTSFPSTQGKLASPPGKKYLVVTCMDARLDPAAAFGIAVGDAHVVRNVSYIIPATQKLFPWTKERS